MTTSSFSEKILQALVAHPALSARQLANQISHASDKTTALISYMNANGKIEKAGVVEGVTAYRITERGMQALGLTIDSNAPAHLQHAKGIPSFATSLSASAAALEPAVQTSAQEQPATDAPQAPSENSESAGAAATMQDLAFPSSAVSRRPGRVERAPTPVRARETLDVIEEVKPRFGLLDSGELIVLRGGSGLPIIFPVEATKRLRDMLAGSRT